MSQRSIRRAAERRTQRLARRAGIGAAVIAGAALPSAASAAEFTVTTTANPGGGSCQPSFCGLNQAVSAANSNPDADVIKFAPDVTGTIRVYPFSGQLVIDSPVSIQGPGPDKLTISGDTDNDGDGDFRVLYSSYADVSISGVTISGGNGKPNPPASIGNGGAIYQYVGSLTLDDVVVTGNSVPVANKHGGAIWSKDSDLTITNSTISGNSLGLPDGLQGTGGGAITAFPGSLHSETLTIRNSTLSGNRAPIGGALYLVGQDRIDIDHSTISGNHAFKPTNSPDYGGDSGGVLLINNDGPTTISDSTISGNRADVVAGGVRAATTPAPVVFRNSTVSGNTAATQAGGILPPFFNGQVSLLSSIVADNTPTDLQQGSATAVVSGFSLIENPGDGLILDNPAGSNRTGVDPQLSPLADNGGPTQTQLIAPTSPAVDAGTSGGLTTDQRGLPRTFLQPGASPLADGTDIGAVELQDVSLDGAKVKAKKSQKVKGAKVQILVEAGASEAVTAEASGSIKAGKSKGGKGKRAKPKAIALKAVTAQAAAGKTAKLKLKPAKKSAGRKLAKQLAAGGKAKASITVTLTDAAGNTADQQVGVKLKLAKKK